MRKSVSAAVRAAKITNEGALSALRSTSIKGRVWNGKRRFNIYDCNGATVIDLLDAVAMASAGLILGYNRSGGVNLVLLLEGDKETFTAYDGEEFAAIAAIFIDFLIDYAVAKFPDIKQEIETQQGAGPSPRAQE